MALIPERIFEKFILTESATFLSLQGVSDPEMDQHFQTINSSQSSQSQTPMLGEALRDGSPPQFETLQNCQPPAHHAYQNEDSQQSNFESWAVSDFDLFDFIGQDDPETFSGETSQNGDPYAQNNQYDSSSKEQKDDLMFTEMQYNDMAFNHPSGMYGIQDINGCGFLQDDRYQNNNGSILNNTINKLHLQQQQNQNQPSTSRLSTIVSNQQPSYRGGRMRSQISTQMGQQQPINPSDLSENVLLPTSSTSPQNNGYMLSHQTIVKSEPGYEMNNSEYFDSTSDAESHYSHGGTRTLQTTSSKPRKYRIKPESERIQPQYKQKRLKNNDAVRRSREKSKQAQLEKDKRLQFLEAEHNEHYKQLSMMKNRIKELENELLISRKNCNCGSQQLFRR